MNKIKTNELPAVMTKQEIAELAGVSYRIVGGWVRAGLITADKRFPGYRKYPRDQVCALLHSLEHGKNE